MSVMDNITVARRGTDKDKEVVFNVTISNVTIKHFSGVQVQYLKK